MAIPVFDKFKSVTADGKVLDYDEIADIPIIRQDLINDIPFVWGYYQHTGATNDKFHNRVIYWYDGTNFQPLQNKEALILTRGNTTTLPTVGATCFLSQESYNRDWVSGETIFGIVGYIESNTIVGRYAVVGTIYDNSPRIVVSSVASIQGEKGEKGDKGDKGDQGREGIQGDPGKDAYQIAVDLGFEGTRQDWINSLKGEKGADGTVAFDDLTQEQKDSLKGENAVETVYSMVLLASGWNESKRQTITNTGQHSNGSFIVAPDMSNYTEYGEAGIYLADVYDGGFIWGCEVVPTTDISVKVLELRGV